MNQSTAPDVNGTNAIDTIGGFPNSMLYAQFNGMGQSSALIVPAVLMNIAGVPGIAANLLLIWVTCKRSNLRGSTNFLLALTALFEILHQSAHFLFLFVTLSGTNFIPYAVALRFQLHSIFGVTAAQTVMASTAADRLLSVAMPWGYEHINGFLYLLCHTLLALCCGGWMAWNAMAFAGQHPQLPVTGYISDMLVLDMEVIFKFIMLLCALNVLLYALVWAMVRCGPASSLNNQQHHSKLFKSLVVIVLIVIGGYMLNNVCRLVIDPVFYLNDIQQWSVNVFGGILLNIGASAETPTLYIFSTDYRKAINREVSRICCCGKKKRKNVVTLVSMAVRTAPNPSHFGGGGNQTMTMTMRRVSEKHYNETRAYREQQEMRRGTYN